MIAPQERRSLFARLHMLSGELEVGLHAVRVKRILPELHIACWLRWQLMNAMQ